MAKFKVGDLVTVKRHSGVGRIIDISNPLFGNTTYTVRFGINPGIKVSAQEKDLRHN